MSIKTNTTNLQALLEQINTLPEANISVDADKIIPTTVTGYKTISVNDISEVSHTMTVELSDPNATVMQYGKNLLPNTVLDETNWTKYNSYYRFMLEHLIPGDYILNADIISEDTDYGYWYVQAIDSETLNTNRTYYASTGNQSAPTLPLKFTINPGEQARFQWYSGSAKTPFTKDFANPQIEAGSISTDYEPYKDPIIQTQGNIEYYSPSTTLIAESNVDIALTYRKSWGMQEQYDRFWDEFQNYGNPKVYIFAFAGRGWTDDTFKPKYDIVSSGNNGSGMFYYSEISEIPVMVDVSGLTQMSQTFQSATKLHTIKKLKCSETTGFTSNTFGSCSSLANIEVEGVIGKSINFANSNLLTHDSLMSIINTLKDYSGSGTTYTLTLHADAKARLSDDEIAIATQKGWTVA